VSVVNVVQQESIPRQGSYIYTFQFIYGFSFIKFQVKHTLDKELKSGLPFYFNEIKGLVWFMVFNATFNNISAISWRRKPVYSEKTTDLPQVTDM
jgi:hypothetical protein